MNDGKWFHHNDDIYDEVRGAAMILPMMVSMMAMVLVSVIVFDMDFCVSISIAMLTLMPIWDCDYNCD